MHIRKYSFTRQTTVQSLTVYEKVKSELDHVGT